MKSDFSRRDFLVRTSATALAAGLWPGTMFAEDAKGENGEFEFLAVNDLHFTDPKLCPLWFEKVFPAMRASAPNAEFLIVSGDLSERATAIEFGGLKDLFPLLKMPVHLTLGNHDVDSKTGDHSIYDEHFPKARNYMVEHRGWQLISVCSAESFAAENTSIPEDTLQWCDQNLKQFDCKKPTLISTHFPLGKGMKACPKNTDVLLDRFKSFNVQHIFNGHWHGYSEMIVNNATVTTNRCCARDRENHDGSPLKGWFVCKAHQGRVTRQFVSVPAELLKSTEKPG